MVNQFDIWGQNRGRTQSVVKEKPKRASSMTPSMLQKYIPALAGEQGPDGLAAQGAGWDNAMGQMQRVYATNPLIAAAQVAGMGLAGYGSGQAQKKSDAGKADYRAKLARALEGGSSADLMALATDQWADPASSALALKMWDRNNPSPDDLLQRQAAEQQLKTGQFNYDQAVEGADRAEQTRLGHQSSVDKYMNDPAYKQQGGDLFSPEMQQGLRQQGVNGVDPADSAMHQQMKPYVDARDYEQAFSTMTAPPAAGEGYTLGEGQVRFDKYGRKIAEGPPKADGNSDTSDIKNWLRTNEDRATRNEPPVSFQEYMTTMKKAGASTTTLDMGGSNDKQVSDIMKDRYDGVKSAANGIRALREAKQAILSGAVTGPWADERLFMSKVGAAFGITDPKIIANTEVFRSTMAQQVAAMIKATVGSTQISNTDRAFAEAAAGGQISLNEGTILRLIDIGERTNAQIIDDYQSRLDKIYPPDSPDAGVQRSRALFEMQDAAPMPGDITRLPQDEAGADAAYDKLPPGTWFQAPDGSMRQKPAGGP